MAEASLSSPSDWQIGPFVKLDPVNPVLTAQSDTYFYCPVRQERVAWEAKDVFNPCAVVKESRVYLFYRAEDTVGKHFGTSRIGLAISDDGTHFTRHKSPVLYPEQDTYQALEWEGGLEDPRIVEDETGTYYITYTAYNGEHVWLCLASSRDLLHWTKHGVVADIGAYPGWQSKAAVIVSRREGNKLIATKIDGQYHMYWGVGALRMAVSDDLLHWRRVLDEAGKDRIVLNPRSEKAYHQVDNVEVEPGPAAVLTEAGIVLFYNGISNPLPAAERTFAHGFPVGNTWVGMQALFDRDDPTRLLARADTAFIRPEKPYEITGQVGNVTFIEGLIFFQNKWWLYYGTADSNIAVAVAEG